MGGSIELGGATSVSLFSRTRRFIGVLCCRRFALPELLVLRHPQLRVSSARLAGRRVSVFGLACRNRRLVLIGLDCRDRRLLIFGLACRNRRFSLFGLARRNRRVLSSALPASFDVALRPCRERRFSFLPPRRLFHDGRVPCCVQLLSEITGWGRAIFSSVNLARSSHGFGYSSVG